MSDIKSDYSDSPRAFEGDSASESSTLGLDSGDFEDAKGVWGTEVSFESGSTSSLEVVGDIRSLSRGDLGQRPKGPVFGVDFLEPNTLHEAELAKIKAEFHIPDSVVMRIPRPLESLSDPDGEVVFFTDGFKHELRLPLRLSVQKILAQIGYAPRQFNPNFWITLLGTITVFGIA
ncbi:unnamed protein product, partial [Prunus brigantina]